MKIRRVRLAGFKGIEAEFPWAPALVFFGRNDAGKTNLLEAIDHGLTAQGLRRRDPLRREDERLALEVLIELEGLGEPGHADRSLLGALLQLIHVPPLFPYAGAKGLRPREDMGELGEAAPLAINRIETPDPNFPDYALELHPGPIGPLDPWTGLDALGSLEEIRARIREDVQRSTRARAKAGSKRSERGLPAHSFADLLDALGTFTRNRIQLRFSRRSRRSSSRSSLVRPSRFPASMPACLTQSLSDSEETPRS